MAAGDSKNNAPSEASAYGKALKDAGCVVESDFGGLAMVDDPASLDGCHAAKAYIGLAEAAVQQIKSGISHAIHPVAAPNKGKPR